MRFVSRVERTISAAHHNGPPGNRCEVNHGHDWRVIVQFSYALDDLNEYGWGPDFGAIKMIIDSFDHKDLNERLAPRAPSAEHFAMKLFSEFADYFGGAPDYVEIFEGAGNSVRYE